jgi:outer membrane protein assembly factor BamA
MRLLFFIFIISISFTSLAQQKMPVARIDIAGNSKTKDYIILRELPFIIGDSLDAKQLAPAIIQAKQLLINTQLFVDVQIDPMATDGQWQIRIQVKERWYLLPLPYFRLVDRNFNQWWVDQNRSLDRVNYGVKFIQNNVSGRNDNLNVWLITGYNRQFSARYTIPFIDKKLTKGFSIGFLHATQKELNIATVANKQVFLRHTSDARKTWRMDASYSYRPDRFKRTTIRLSYFNETIADTILKVQKNYYPGQTNHQAALDLSYRYQYINVSNIVYPTSGYYTDFFLMKRFASQREQSIFQMSARYLNAKKISNKFFLILDATTAYKSPVDSIFSNSRLIGYGGMQLRGLEYYVVDGTAGAVSRNALHFNVKNFTLTNPVPIKNHEKIPIRLYLKMFADAGYAYHKYAAPSNTLSNTLLYTYGVGLDLVSVYDFVFRVEYSRNQLGRDGLYLQGEFNF